MAVSFQIGASYLFLVCKKRFPSVKGFVGYLQKKDLSTISKSHTRVLHDSDCFYPVSNPFKCAPQPFAPQALLNEVNSRLLPDNVHILALKIESNKSVSLAELKNVEARHLVSEEVESGLSGQLIVADSDDDDSDSDSDGDW